MAHRHITIGMVTANLEEENFEILENLMSKFQRNYNDIFEVIYERRTLDKAERMRRSLSALRIQKFVTNKLSVWYKLMKNVMDIQIKTNQNTI